MFKLINLSLKRKLLDRKKSNKRNGGHKREKGRTVIKPTWRPGARIWAKMRLMWATANCDCIPSHLPSRCRPVKRQLKVTPYTVALRTSKMKTCCLTPFEEANVVGVEYWYSCYVKMIIWYRINKKSCVCTHEWVRFALTLTFFFRTEWKWSIIFCFINQHCTPCQFLFVSQRARIFIVTFIFYRYWEHHGIDLFIPVTICRSNFWSNIVSSLSFFFLGFWNILVTTFGTWWIW